VPQFISKMRNTSAYPNTDAFTSLSFQNKLARPFSPIRNTSAYSNLATFISFLVLTASAGSVDYFEASKKDQATNQAAKVRQLRF